MKFLTTIFIMACAPALAFAQTHIELLCPNHIAARQCNQHCKPTETKMAFLTDRTTSSVMWKRYGKNNEIQYSWVLKSCTIFSDKDWRCEDLTPTGYRKFTLVVDSMADGLYSHELTDETTTSEVSNEMPRFFFNWCAKPVR